MRSILLSLIVTLTASLALAGGAPTTQCKNKVNQVKGHISGVAQVGSTIQASTLEGAAMSIYCADNQGSEIGINEIHLELDPGFQIHTPAATLAIVDADGSPLVLGTPIRQTEDNKLMIRITDDSLKSRNSFQRGLLEKVIASLKNEGLSVQVSVNPFLTQTYLVKL